MSEERKSSNFLPEGEEGDLPGAVDTDSDDSSSDDDDVLDSSDEDTEDSDEENEDEEEGDEEEEEVNNVCHRQGAC